MEHTKNRSIVSAKSVMSLMLILAVLLTNIPAVFAGQVRVQAASKKVSLSKKKAAIAVGGKVKLKLKNATASKVKWTTSKKSVATVKSGVVTGKSKGTATIKATYKKKTYTCKVTVVKAKLSKTSVSLRKGKSVTLKLTGGNGKTKWASSNKKVAAVTSKGKVTGKGAGTATITATNAGKKYTCKVRVLAVKKLGSKKLTAEKDSATIGGIGVGFMPGTIDKSSTLTVSEVSGAPKFDGVSMKTYDFKLSGSKLGEGDLAKLEIPLTVPSGQQAVAAYYNEDTGEYEPAASLYSDGKITILTDHFSAFSVGTTVEGTKAAISDENTTKAYIMFYYSLPDPKLDTSRSLEILTETMNNKAPTKSCIQLGMEAVRDSMLWAFVSDGSGYAMDFGVNFANSTGCTCGITDFINNHGTAFGLIGFGIAMLDATFDAIDGRGQMALFKGAFANVALMTPAMLTGIGWGVAGVGALSFLIAVPTYMLKTVYTDALTNNEKKWFKVYNTYYNSEAKRHPYQWRNTLQKYFDDKNLTAQQVSDAIQKEVDDYVEEFWKDRSNVAVYYSEAVQKANGLEGGLNPTLEKRISDEKRRELYNGDIKTVLEWFMAKQQKDAKASALQAADELAKGFDRTVTIQFYDETSGGAASQLSGWTVKWKEIPSNIKDPQSMETVLNSKGVGKVKFNTWAYFEYGFKPEVQIIAPDGALVDELRVEWKLKNNKINVMTADVIDYIATNAPALSPTELEIDEGQTAYIEVQNVSVDNVKYSSSNTSVAKVSAGPGNTLAVTGVKKGTATITLTSGKLKTTCAVTVREFENSKTTQTLYVGQTREVNVDTLMDLSKYNNSDDYVSVWFESKVTDEKIVDPYVSGNTLMLKGLKAGNTKVSLTLYGKKLISDAFKLTLAKATITVKVKKQSESISISKKNLTIKEGESKSLSLKNGTTKISKGVTWKSSNTSIATVSSAGKVKGIKAGNATITATYKNKDYTCSVAVKKNAASDTQVETPVEELFVGSYDVKIGKSITINPPAGMDASKIKWSSSNTSIVTVNSSGKVTGRGQGVAYVYADYDGTRYKFEIWSGDYLD